MKRPVVDNSGRELAKSVDLEKVNALGRRIVGEMFLDICGQPAPPRLADGCSLYLEGKEFCRIRYEPGISRLSVRHLQAAKELYLISTNAPQLARFATEFISQTRDLMPDGCTFVYRFLEEKEYEH